MTLGIRTQLIHRSIVIIAVTLYLGGCSYIEAVVPGLEQDVAAVQQTPTNWQAQQLTPSASVGAVSISDITNALDVSALHIVSTTDAGAGNNWDSHKHPASSSPVSDGTLVFSMDALGVVSAHKLNSLDDDALWEYTQHTSDEQSQGGGLALIGSQIIITTDEGLVIALDKRTGTKRWQRALRRPVRSAPVAGYAQVLVITADNQLFALNASNGSIIWRHRGLSTSSAIINNGKPVLGSDMATVIYSNGDMVTLDSNTGYLRFADSLLPHTPDAYQVTTGGQAVLVDDVIYASTQEGMSAAYNALSGIPLWELPIASRFIPLTSDNAAFILTTDMRMVAIHRATGQVFWVTPLALEEDEFISGFTRINTTLLAITNQGRAIIVDAVTGTRKQDIDMPTGVISQPLLSGNALIVQTDDATLHLLRSMKK